MQEMEAKAPILKRQREEYERLQKSVSSLSAKLEQAFTVRTEESCRNTKPYSMSHCQCMLPNGYLHNKSRNDYSWIFQEIHRLQKEADESNKRASVLERDNQRFEVQLADMSQQVRPDGTTEASVSYGREK